MSNYLPLKITPKTLLDLGFEKYDWNESYFIKFNNNHLMIQFYNDDIFIFTTIVSKDRKGHKTTGRNYLLGKKKIEYVHKLQNLYFAHTDKELILKTETNETT